MSEGAPKIGPLGPPANAQNGPQVPPFATVLLNYQLDLAETRTQCRYHWCIKNA